MKKSHLLPTFTFTLILTSVSAFASPQIPTPTLYTLTCAGNDALCRAMCQCDSAARVACHANPWWCPNVCGCAPLSSSSYSSSSSSSSLFPSASAT
ncbi:hypothetical protein F4775DRAFT_561347 [Biscogniauxia sp. FL1348]|nr:hypothetical protein F4775DRAFT_561347 [Biscogniauxia sp. FL1348]